MTGEVMHPGLCGDCVHARTITSDRGSIFYLCQLSFTDQRFAKYPKLPVIVCPGYRKTAEEGEGAAADAV
jgi:hypothetical protein